MSARPEGRAYLNKSSNAFRALVGAVDLVSRSTFVRGSNHLHVLRASFGDTRAGTGCWHSNAALVSKWTHCAQVWRSALQRGHLPSALHASATVSSWPHGAHR